MAGQSVRFLGVGLGSMLVHYAIMALLASLCGVSALLASQAGFAAGGVFSYTLNRAFTFRASVPHRRAAPRYANAVLLGWVVNGTVFAGLHALLGTIWPAQLGASAAVACSSFAIQRQIVFGTRPARPGVAD
jgi:putative flippase GtrA